MKATAEPMLEVVDVKKYFPQGRSIFRTAGWVRAVDGVSWQVFPGETLALVGESGCGKSTLSRLALNLETPTAGQVLFRGQDVQQLTAAGQKQYRRDVQVVFQDSAASLNPRKTTVQTLVTALRLMGKAAGTSEAEIMASELLERVGLSPAEIFLGRYPHQLSGGQRQRVGIARALATEPKLIVADEPVSALDISVRAQILSVFAQLQAEQELGYLFISHDLAVVRSMSQRVAVMYLGKLMEIGPVETVFAHQVHPYTEALIAATPVPEPTASKGRKVLILKGDVPSPANPPAGCPFHPRCPVAVDQCSAEMPLLVDTELAPGHKVFCLRWQERLGGRLRAI